MSHKSPQTCEGSRSSYLTPRDHSTMLATPLLRMLTTVIGGAVRRNACSNFNEIASQAAAMLDPLRRRGPPVRFPVRQRANCSEALAWLILLSVVAALEDRSELLDHFS